jgi:Pyruvate/2-oxoacid:ferredoxin oxidoreductase gamma subunit
MKYELIIAGTRREDVQSLASLLARAGEHSALFVRRSEVVPTELGAFEAHVRMGDEPIYCATVTRGRADLVISFDPQEALRCSAFIRAGGALISNTFPENTGVLMAIRSHPRAQLVDATWLAEELGGQDREAAVLAGAAAHILPIPQEVLSATIGLEGESMLAAFLAGRAAARGEHLIDVYAS